MTDRDNTQRESESSRRYIAKKD